MKKTILLFLTAIMLVSLTACSSKEERATYKQAVEMFESGKYSGALNLFESVIDYKDAEKYANACRYNHAMQVLSPDSTIEDGYSGRVVDCTDANYSQYAQAVELLKKLDGYKDSEKMLRDANKLLEKYTKETQTQRLVNMVSDKFLGYVKRCDYDGSTFTLHFSPSYPITYEVLVRGQSETTMAESWNSVRGMFTETIFEFFPDCTVEIQDSNGKTLGKYCKGSDVHDVTVLFDVATRPY